MTQKNNLVTAPGAAISDMINEAVKQGLERDYSLYDMGDNGEVTLEAARLVRERLRAFPDVCLRAREADGAMKIVLDCEICAIKYALKGISGDPYYQIVPDLYFHGIDKRGVTYRLNCDLATINRHEKRLISDMALLLYGVQVRWHHPLFALSG